jgi:hypothetical protein
MKIVHTSGWIFAALLLAVALGASSLLGCSAAALSQRNNAPGGNVSEAASNSLTPAGPEKAVTPSSNESHLADSPESVLRNFYGWYLGEIRSGHEPWKDDAKLHTFFADEFFKLHDAYPTPPNMDPILGLEAPYSNWYNMKVTFAKTQYYHKKGCTTLTSMSPTVGSTASPPSGSQVIVTL